MLIRIIIFLVLNFGALAVGAYFTNPGVASDWYQNMNQAPWTPPGWVFGAAWTTIMICFSIYMAFLWGKVEDKNVLLSLYITQLILNMAWNPVFFHLRQVGFGLIVISALAILVLFFMFNYWKTLKEKSLLLLPYGIWIIIATSLNAYIWTMN